MRKLLLLPALLLSVMHIHAGENDVQASITGTPTVGGLFPHFGLGNPHATMPGNQRMIAKVYAQYKNGSFIPVDSVTYQYSNDRGSIPNPEDINNDDHVLFDISTTYAFNAPSGTYENSRQRVQNFIDNKVNELVYKKWHATTSSWKNAERYLYTYDNSGKMHSSVLQLWYGTLWTNDINSVLSYDQNNNIVQMNSSTYTIDFVYDQHNNLVTIEDKVWSHSAGWSNNERKNYKYNGGDISEYVLEKWVNGNWENTGKWEYAYDANANVILSTEYVWASGSWHKMREEQFTYDAVGNMLEKVEKKWNTTSGAFENSRKEVRAYNVNQLPTSITGFTWDASIWTHSDDDINVRYYYEQYFPANINDMAGEYNMAVYPVPAATNINISFKLNKAQDFSVAIKNISGNIIHAEVVRSATTYNNNISVNDLPSGTYFLHVNGANVNMVKKVAIVH